MFAPPGRAKGGSIISAGAKGDISAFHRLADCTLEVLLGQVRVTHRHLKCPVARSYPEELTQGQVDLGQSLS